MKGARGVAVAVLALAGASLASCAAILGIEDLPPAVAEAGPPDGGGDADGGVGPGTLDIGFGTGGVLALPDFESAPSIVVNGDQIVLVGKAKGELDAGVILLRGTKEGAFDPYLSIVDVPKYHEISTLAAGPSNGAALVSTHLEGFDEERGKERIQRRRFVSNTHQLGHDTYFRNANPDHDIAAAPGGRTIGADNTGDGGRLTVQAYTAGMDLDPGFGSGGVIGVAEFPDVQKMSLWVSPSGEVLVSGSYGTVDAGDARVYALRFFADGGRDPAYAPGGGKYRYGKGTFAVAAAGNDAGHLFIAGHLVSAQSPFDEHWTILKLAADGSLDRTFASGGVYEHDPWDEAPSIEKRLVAVAAALDGRILAIAKMGNQVILHRLLPTGKQDQGFANASKAEVGTGIPGGRHSLALQEDGKILVTWKAEDGVVKLARYRP